MSAQADEQETTALIGCAQCGAACPDGLVTEAEDVTFVSPAGSRGREQTVDLGRCPACWAVAQTAESVLSSHPGVVGALGPAGAARAVANVAVALDVMGQVDALRPNLPDRDLSALISHLSAVGAGLPWRRHAQTATPAPYRYAYLAGGVRRLPAREGDAVLGARAAGSAITGTGGLPDVRCGRGAGPGHRGRPARPRGRAGPVVASDAHLGDGPGPRKSEAPERSSVPAAR